MVDIYRDAKRRVIYPPLFTVREGDSCFTIYQIRWIKNAASLMATISSSETFAKRHAIFLSIHKTVNSQGYSELREPIKTREKLLSTDLVNTNIVVIYLILLIENDIIYLIILIYVKAFTAFLIFLFP